MAKDPIDRAGLRLKQARETAALDAAVREVRAPATNPRASP